MNGYLYMIRRNNKEIKFLCRGKSKQVFIKQPDLNDLMLEHKSQALLTAKENRIDWELYFEQGSIEKIVNNWLKKGKKFITNSFKPILREESVGRITKASSFEV